MNGHNKKINCRLFSQFLRWVRKKDLGTPAAALILCSFYMFLCFSVPFPDETVRVRGGEVKEGKISGVNKDPIPFSDPRFSLQSLDWLVGSWQLTTPTAVMKWNVSFAANRHYLVIQEELRLVATDEKYGVLRIIVQDPVSHLFNVSIFGSDGSFGTGLLEAEDNAADSIDIKQDPGVTAVWVLNDRILLPDGQPSTMTEIFYPLSDGRFRWESISRTIAKTNLPNIGPIDAEKIPPFTIDTHVLSTPFPALLEADE